MTATCDFRELRRSEQPQFEQMMARAFAHDPLIVAVFGSAEQPKSEQLRRQFLGCMFRMTRLLGGTALGLFAGEALVGAAIMEPPVRSQFRHTLAMLAAALLFIPLMLRLPWSRAKQLNHYLRETRAHAPTLAHHYLMMVGVDPGCQGCGYGRRLVTELCRRVDENHGSQGIALDTENERNVAMYEAWGFKRGPDFALRDVHVFTMFRPRGANHGGRNRSPSLESRPTD